MLGCSCPLSPAIAQHSRTQSPPPRQRTAQLDAGLAKPDRRGKNAEADGGKLAFIRAVQVFPCRGAHTSSPAAFQFYPISFHAANRFFVSFLTQERNVLLVSFSPLSPPLIKQRPPPRLEEGVALLLSIHAYPQSTRGSLRRVPSHVRHAVQRPRAQVDRAAAIVHNAAVLRVHADV